MYEVRFSQFLPDGSVHLSASKSLSNRALILSALSGTPGRLSNLSDAADTRALQAGIPEGDRVIDAGHGGATLRFLLAYKAITGAHCTLTGSERLRERPVATLVDALRILGARIRYVEREGCLPLRTEGFGQVGHRPVLRVRGDISSQFISALLMVAPQLAGGLLLEVTGTPVSNPYLDMTIGMMSRYGVTVKREGNMLLVPEGRYKSVDIHIESDWSAASYFYALLALSDGGRTIELPGLYADSIQGDRAVSELMEDFGIHTVFHSGGCRIEKRPLPTQPEEWHANLVDTPDLAQTFAVLCAGLGVRARIDGLQTLPAKETDRVSALNTELSKIGSAFVSAGTGADLAGFVVPGRFTDEIPVFDTWQDHRMAMSLAVLSAGRPVVIRDPLVVDKSFPGFWGALEGLGALIRPIR